MRPGQFPADPLWWEIAYVGGRRVRGRTRAQWRRAPDGEVLAVRQPVDKTYLRLGVETYFTIRVQTVDYYWLEADGTINGGQAPDAPPNNNTVKRGGWSTDEEFQAVYAEFLRDVDVAAG